MDSDVSESFFLQRVGLSEGVLGVRRGERVLNCDPQGWRVDESMKALRMVGGIGRM